MDYEFCKSILSSFVQCKFVLLTKRLAASRIDSGVTPDDEYERDLARIIHEKAQPTFRELL